MTQEVHKIIGHNIAVIRNKLGIKQFEFAEMMGLTKASMTNIESGSQKISIVRLYEFAKKLNVTLDKLLPMCESQIPFILQKGEMDKQNKKIEKIKIASQNLSKLMEDL